MSATKVGKTLGNFRILECLGSGGAGMIWKAEDLTLGRIVALKALRPELAADGEMAERFRAEARTLAKLSHPNVASLYSLIEDEDGLFLVLEYVEGNTLAALLATSGPLPFDSAFALFHQVLDGVGHAHEAGVVHRDLKPANLMVDARGRVKVMDFGIARMQGAARTTHHGKLVGTPEYMSPEQVRGEDATIRSDLYCLGVVLFEMLTGQPPFRAPASFELMRAQLEDAPPDPSALRPDLDPRVASALLRALAKLPAERFATTRELQEALRRAGATRRGATIVPVWRDVAPATASSEAPTLLSNAAAIDSTEAEATVTETAAPTPPPNASEDEPSPAPTSAPSALDDDIDAAFADEARAAAPEGSSERRVAPATRVIDAADDTETMSARPTRMLDGAPFAAHAQALTRAAGGAPRLHGYLWWALATAALLALAFGAVQWVDRAPALTATEAEPPAIPAPDAAESPARPAETAPTEPAQVVPAEKSASTAPAAPPKKEAKAAPRAMRSEAAQEESGWVIRR
ncbi:MAG TPA: protein kinase [Myxococcota bacterium]|nr:protein kinase [Myxococcota bacterium]